MILCSGLAVFVDCRGPFSLFRGGLWQFGWGVHSGFKQAVFLAVVVGAVKVG